MNELNIMSPSLKFPEISRNRLKTLQVNLGYLCNQTCKHCHVNAGPNRKEIMDENTVNDVVHFMKNAEVAVLDLTGGAPELNPHFRYLVKEAVASGIHVIDRCNLTVLLEEGMEGMIEFLHDHKVEIVSSMPCYLEENVDRQRGNGVYHKSIEVLQQLNRAGFGKDGPELNLVYNPGGASLPPRQDSLEQDYKNHLYKNFGIEFNHLFTIINMPINRFGRKLESEKKLKSYIDLLAANHHEENLTNVMCKTLVSVDWRGYVYDCDFNQMLEIPLADGAAIHISRLDYHTLPGKNIAVREHCFGCTAGSGSSCGGALS